MIPLLDMLNHDHGQCNTGWPNQSRPAPSHDQLHDPSSDGPRTSNGGTSTGGSGLEAEPYRATGRMLVQVPIKRGADVLFSYGTKPNLSLVDVQRFRNELHLQGYHLRSQPGLVLRTQSMIQLPEPAAVAAPEQSARRR